MKRVCSALLIFSLILAGGCSSSGKDADTATTTTTVAETTVSETTEAVTEALLESGQGILAEGASEESSDAGKDSETTTETTVEESQVLGNKEDYKVTFPVKNSTGLTITGIYVKESGEADFGPENLVDAAFADKETRDAFFKVEENKEYDIRIIYEDGTTSDDIKHFIMRDITEGELVIFEGKTVLLLNGQQEITPTPEETTKKATKKTKETNDPNDGCIGDDGLFY